MSHRRLSAAIRPFGRINAPRCGRINSQTSRRSFHDYSLARTADGLTFGNGQSSIKLSNVWLRDNCRCSQCINQDTQQRAFDTFQIPSTINIEEVNQNKDGFQVKWSDSHTSQHSLQWLLAATTPEDGKSVDFNIKPSLWGSEIQADPPAVSYQDVMDDQGTEGIARLTDQIRKRGLCFVEGTPVSPEATQQVLEKIGPIRQTHYGGFYDFIPDLALADTAYTNLALAAHTDTTYFTEPAGLQAFHMLSHRSPPGQDSSAPSGGKSLLVDGFKVAQQLKAEHPDYYRILSSVKLPWHASGNEGIAIAPDAAYPVLETSEEGELRRVRWNNDDRGVVPLTNDVALWYEAARKWNSLLTDSSNEFWFQLTPGRLLIFDNWRVLHGRSAFLGERRMCGAYINRDDFISRWKSTNYSRDDVIRHNLNLTQD